MFDATLVAGLRELGKAAKANLRFHLAAGTPFCADPDWYVTESGAACLAAMALSKDVAGPLSAFEDVPPGLSANYAILWRGAGGPEVWGPAEREASVDVLRASVEEALRHG